MPKKIRQKPTVRQRMALANLRDNGGNVSQAMKDAGYSHNTAHTPQKLTDSKSWNDLIEEYLPDSLLATKHKELLTVKKKITTRRVNGVVETEEELDSGAIKAGLDMAYKVKGKYKEDNEQKRVVVNINVEKIEEINNSLDKM